MRDRSTDGRPVAAFCHIPKTAGLQVARLLQRYHGPRHLAVRPVQGHLYVQSDLRVDLQVHRHVVSLAGHSLRPHIDYGAPGARLSWYTILRNPVDRYLSHFMQEVEHGGKPNDLSAWIRDNPNRANFQVRMLAGREDVDAAVAALDRMAVVGFLEDLVPSILLIREAFGWSGMEPTLPRSVNVSSTSRRDETRAAADHLRNEIIARNELDLRLYEYARAVLWPKQVASFGEQRLEELAAGARPSGRDIRSSVNRGGYLAYRHAVQRPLVSARRIARRR